jgi:hypothetical protein
MLPTSEKLIYFTRAIFFGIVLGYAVFYILLYFKPIIEDIAGKKKFNVDMWWISIITISVVMGMIGAALLM